MSERESQGMGPVRGGVWNYQKKKNVKVLAVNAVLEGKKNKILHGGDGVAEKQYALLSNHHCHTNGV